MKKIALITASVLALGAASVAADRTGATSGPAPDDFVLASLPGTPAAAPREGQLNAAAIRAAVKRADQAGAERTHAVESRELNQSDILPAVEVRRVRALPVDADSCAKAHWPYYPPECLERVDSAGL